MIFVYTIEHDVVCSAEAGWSGLSDGTENEEGGLAHSANYFLQQQRILMVAFNCCTVIYQL
jgi:hypothetical protein